MVQPIQYQVPGVTDPFAGVLQGLRLGATLQELDFARQDRARKEEELRLRQQQQLQQQQYLSDFVRRPNKTAQDYTEALLRVPSLKDQFTESWKIENTEQTNKSLSDMGRVFAALSQGKADTAYADLSQQAADLKAAGAPQERVDAVSKMAELARTNPEFLKSLTGTRLAAQGDRGKAIVDAALKLTAAEQGRMISTPADKIKAGLVNDKGAPLPGTFFQEPGKEPKLITGEKPKDQFVTVDAKKLAEQFGITGVEPGIYKVNTATNEVTAVGRGGTTVYMKTEGPPPPGYQYERDANNNVVRMVPIPGGPAAAKLESEQRARTATEAGRLQAATVVVDNIRKLQDLLKVEKEATGFGKVNPYTQVTGLAGRTGEGLPGSARKNAIAYRDAIVANIGFEQLNKMRQESPTGGALGNVTERELSLLQSTLGSIDFDTSLPVLEENLTKILPVYESVMRKAAAYPNAAQYGFGTGAPTAAPVAAPVAAPAAAPAAAPVAIPTAVSTPSVTTRALPTQGAIDFLRRNPSLRRAFDEKYGPGMADRILGGQ